MDSMTDQIMLQLLSDTLKKEIKLINIPLEIELQTVNSIPSDSLYARMYCMHCLGSTYSELVC